MNSTILRPTTTDAVVVVPGIMGSELIDCKGAVQWGLKPSLLARAWLTQQVDTLLVTADELAGAVRLRPTRLLRVPSYMPMLGGLEPYSALLDRVTQCVPDPRAVAEFPYDWRLSIEYNAALLVRSCEQHLAAWRAVVAEHRWADPDGVQVALVAHSMGGLIARYATTVLGAGPLVSKIITLGTPYYGAVKGMRMLATGEGAPVPKRAARALALTCPGVYDLLPRYRCVDGDRLLTTPDVVAVGGSADLSDAAADHWAALGLRPTGIAEPAPSAWPATSLTAVVGADQPTLQSLRFDAGECLFDESLSGVDHRGDSTVYRGSAAPAGTVAIPLPQKHGALAKTGEALTIVADKLVGADTGPPLGTRPVGADIPDLAASGEPVQVVVSGAGGDPNGVSVISVNLDTNVPTRWDAVRRDGDLLRYTRAGLPAGLHRIEVKAGGYSPVSDLILITDRTSP